MVPGSGMAQGANSHANVATGADLGPIVETGLFVKLPTQRAIDLLRIILFGDLLRRATHGTLFTQDTKTLYTQIDWFVGHQGHVGGYRAQPEAWAKLHGQQVDHSTEFAHPGIHSHRRQNQFIVAQMIGGGTQTAKGKMTHRNDVAFYKGVVSSCRIFHPISSACECWKDGINDDVRSCLLLRLQRHHFKRPEGSTNRCWPRPWLENPAPL